MKKIYIILFFLITATATFGQQKFALVIGNGNYINTTKLNNPVNDANDMAVALQGLGFTVDKVLNGTQDQMVNAIMRLKNRLSVSKDSYGFLFYAGHGIQSNGENYLIPVDANIPSENFLRNRTVSVQEMLDELNDAGNNFNVVVLDACRDNPFSWRRSGSRGLTIVAQQPADSIIVYATSAGSTAADGTDRNGLFTSHLLKNLKPDIEVTEIFRRTGADVARASNNQQRPAVYNQFYGTAYLGARPVVNTPIQPTPTPVPSANIPVQPQPSLSPPVIQPAPTPNNSFNLTGTTWVWINGDNRYVLSFINNNTWKVNEYNSNGTIVWSKEGGYSISGNIVKTDVEYIISGNTMTSRGNPSCVYIKQQ